MVKPQKKKSAPAKSKFVLQKIDYRWPALIAIVAFALYVNTLHHGYVLDDSVSIVKNQFVQKGFDGIGGLMKVDLLHFSNLSLGYFRPISLITFAIEHEFFGNAPHISHLVNVLIYSLTGFILCLLLMEFFRGHHKLFPFLICLLYIADPADHTEVVANLKSRDELLSFLGIITMLFLMVRYDGSGKKRYLIISLVVFYLALLSKETAVTGALLLPVALYFRRQKSIGEALRKSIPFILAVVVFFIHKQQVLGTSPEHMFKEINNYPYQDSKFPSSMVVFAYYIRLLLLPHPLIYDYSYNQVQAGSFSNPLTFIGLILFGILVYFAIKGFNKKTIWGFALAIFFVSMLPAIGFVMLKGGIITERFLYPSSLGFSIALVYFLAKLLKVDFRNAVTKPAPATVQKNQQQEISKEPFFNNRMIGMIAAAAVIIIGYSFKTIDRNKAWKNNITLYSTDVVNASNSVQTNRHFGHELLEASIIEKDSLKKIELFNRAYFHLNKAVTINPRFGEAWGELGRLYTDTRFIPDSAIYYYRRCIQATPGAFITHSNLGLIYLALRKYELASFYFNRAIEINPNFKDARDHAARLRKATGIDVSAYPGGEDPRLGPPDFAVPGRR